MPESFFNSIAVDMIYIVILPRTLPLKLYEAIELDCQPILHAVVRGLITEEEYASRMTEVFFNWLSASEVQRVFDIYKSRKYLQTLN